MNKKPPLYYVALQAMKAYEQANFNEYRKAKEARKQKDRRERGLNVRIQMRSNPSS